MKDLANYLSCGYWTDSQFQSYGQFVVKFSDIGNIIIPFFCNTPIVGIKSKDFEDFCIVADFINNRDHLTEKGLEEIRKIKAGTNTNRGNS